MKLNIKRSCRSQTIDGRMRTIVIGCGSEPGENVEICVRDTSNRPAYHNYKYGISIVSCVSDEYHNFTADNSHSPLSP